MADAARRFVDLHTHSTASDGRLTPAQLVAMADARGLAAMALTDHDTLAGLAEALEAARACPRLRFVPGIEVSVTPQQGTMHVLGLGVDPACRQLNEMVDYFQDGRRQRNPRIIARLCELGLKITMADVLAAAGAKEGQEGSVIVGRLHIAEALLRKGYIHTTLEAFEKYLARGCPAYVERARLTAKQAAEAIHAAGGLAFAAHPSQWNCDNFAQLERILRDLLTDGLDGLEVYHSDHTPFLTRHLFDLARRLNLPIVGGSDFHGQAKPGVDLGWPKVPLAAVLGPATGRLLGTA